MLTMKIEIELCSKLISHKIIASPIHTYLSNCFYLQMKIRNSSMETQLAYGEVLKVFNIVVTCRY